MSARPMVFARFNLRNGKCLMVNPYAVTALREGEQEDLTLIFVDGSDDAFTVMGTIPDVVGEMYEAAGPMAEFGGHS